MKKRLFLYIAILSAVTAALSACEDHRSDNMEEFQTMVYFRNGGEQSLTLFRTGEDGFYRIPVCKSGRNLSGTANAVIIPFDEAQMSMYNIQYETDYALIPSSLYTFTDENRSPLGEQTKVELSFGPEDSYKVVNVAIKTVALSALMEANPDKQYVLGMQVFADSNVSKDINLIVLKPDVEVPEVSLVTSGVEAYRYTSSSPLTQTYHNTITLNMEENLWDFNCTIAPASAEWLADFNYSNGKNYDLLPASQYILSTTTVAFKKGELDASFDIEISREGMDMLKEYAIPILITGCSKSEFVVNQKKNAYILNLRLDPDQITLTSDMVSVSCSHNGDGGGAPALVDGDVTTYWHSVYSTHNGDPVYGEYVDIALKSPLKSIVLSYCTRHNNNNGIPTHIQVYVRESETASWTMIGDEQTDEMSSASTAQWVTLSAMKADKSFKYIRMAIVEAASGDMRAQGTTSFTALGELQLFGTN
jgi:hypothetical protein